MDDLISRDNAIKDAESWVAVDEHEKRLQNDVIEWLKQLPSALGTDCISRQAAIDAINASRTIYSGALGKGLAMAAEKLRELPTAQPKRGKWEMGIDERFVECSECGLMTTRNELRGLAAFGKNEPNFCPNCGADMRQREEGET